MKVSLLVCAATLATAHLATAQYTPHYELFAGGSYLRVHASGTEANQLTGLPAIEVQPHNQNFNLYGWDTSLTENVNSWFGCELDFGGFYGSPAANFLYPASELVSPTPNFAKRVPIVTRYQTYMFGPRFAYRRYGAVVLFAHVLVGVANASTSLNESAVVASDFSVLPQGSLKSSTGVAASPGVGIDLRLNDKLTIRPFQLDYLLTRLYGARQDNAQVSAGLVFTFGEK
jgi:hypothetical protein